MSPRLRVLWCGMAMPCTLSDGIRGIVTTIVAGTGRAPGRIPRIWGSFSLSTRAIGRSKAVFVADSDPFPAASGPRLIRPADHGCRRSDAGHRWTREAAPSQPRVAVLNLSA